MIMDKINSFGEYLRRMHVWFGSMSASGSGAYHGMEGFIQVNHARSVFIQDQAGHVNLPMRAPHGRHGVFERAPRRRNRLMVH